MKFVRPIPILCIAAVIALGALFVAGIGDSGRPAKDEAIRFRGKRISDVAKKGVRKSVRIESEVRNRFETSNQDDALAKVKNAPASVDEQLEKAIGRLMKEIVKLIQNGDFDQLQDLLDMARRNGFGIPADDPRKAARLAIIKRQILDAISGSDFAGAALADLAMEFAADENVDVAKQASELLMEALRDSTLGDYQRAEIIIAAAKEIDSQAKVYRLCQEMGKLRNSVRVNVITTMYETGTEAVKSQIPRLVRNLTYDPSMKTPDQLGEWLEQNPDSLYDDAYYGPKGPAAKKAE